MRALWNSAIGLLIVTGGLLGLTLPFGKLSGEAGVSPAAWSFLISSGTGGVLLLTLLLRGERARPNVHKLRYFFVVAAVSFAVPNLMMFSAMPHLGAGYTGIMFTLSPVVTLLLSMLLRVRPPKALGIAGIAVGFVGAAMVALTRGEAGQPAALFWIFVGLLIPVALASGNVYRTYDWPADADPIELAAGSHLAAAGILFLVILLSGQAASILALGHAPTLSAAQVASSAGMFAFFFRLQAVGGPVYLSQIGYVAAAVGLVSGALFLGERYEALTWIGALVIAVGVAMTTKAQAEGQTGYDRAGNGSAREVTDQPKPRDRTNTQDDELSLVEAALKFLRVARPRRPRAAQAGRQGVHRPALRKD